MVTYRERYMSSPTKVGQWFDGATYVHYIDSERLGNQLGQVWALMRDGKWRTLAEINERCHGTEAAISARLRDLRKPRFGQHYVDRRRIGPGLFEYRIRPRKT